LYLYLPIENTHSINATREVIHWTVLLGDQSSYLVAMLSTSMENLVDISEPQVSPNEQ